MNTLEKIGELSTEFNKHARSFVSVGIKNVDGDYCYFWNSTNNPIALHDNGEVQITPNVVDRRMEYQLLHTTNKLHSGLPVSILIDVLPNGLETFTSVANPTDPSIPISGEQLVRTLTQLISALRPNKIN